MPCSDDTCQTEDAAPKEINEEKPDFRSAMCVPINVRFFDPVSSQLITQVKAGQPFVVRVGVSGVGGDTCQGTAVNLTYTVTVPPNTVATVSSVAALAEQAINAVAAIIPVTLLVQNPGGQLTQVYSNGNQAYLGATITPSTALSGTTLTVTAKNPLKPDTPSGTIAVVP